MTPTPHPNSILDALKAQDAFNAAHPEIAATLDAAWREARRADSAATLAEADAYRARRAAKQAWEAALVAQREAKVDYGHPLANAMVAAPNYAAATALLYAAR